mgnify:CR=1 FL=1
MEDNKRKKTSYEVYMTHQEISDVLGISRAAVSDMEKRALRKLKKVLDKRGITIDDFFGKDRDK